MAKEEVIPKPKKIVTPIDELQVMVNMMEDGSCEVLQRWVRRYTEILRIKSFRLNPSSPSFAIDHASYFNQAVGLKKLLITIKDAENELNKIEK